MDARRLGGYAAPHFRPLRPFRPFTVGRYPSEPSPLRGQGHSLTSRARVCEASDWMRSKGSTFDYSWPPRYVPRDISSRFGIELVSKFVCSINNVFNSPTSYYAPSTYYSAVVPVFALYDPTHLQTPYFEDIQIVHKMDSARSPHAPIVPQRRDSKEIRVVILVTSIVYPSARGIVTISRRDRVCSRSREWKETRAG
jgi:hypothetical protein